MNFFRSLVAHLSPPLALAFIFLVLSVALFNHSQDAQAASFSKPSYCTADSIPSLGLNSSTTKSNLVVSVHGWNGTALSLAASSKNKNSTFEAKDYDWRDLARMATPSVAVAQRVGTCIGYDIANSQFTYVHLIGHSLGSTVIDAASDTVQTLVGDTKRVSLTGLDSYIGIVPINFGDNAEFVDHYFATGGLDGPRTNWQLPNACNIDVTGLMPFGGGTDYHGWPVSFYGISISNPVDPSYIGYGFALHKEHTNQNPSMGAKCFAGQVIPLQPCSSTFCPTTNPTPANCTVPTLTSPNSGTTVSSGSSVTFTWNTTCPTSILEITSVNGTSTSKSTVTTSSKQYTKSLSTGNHTIRIQGKDSSGKTTDWSSSTSVISGSPTVACNTPTITQPISGGNFASGSALTFKWSSGCPSNYFEFTGGPYTSAQTAGWVSGQEYTYTQGLWPGSYSLKIRGKNSSGTTTNWSNNVAFTVGGGSSTPTPLPTCSGDATVTDVAGKCAGISGTSCRSLSGLGLSNLRSVSPNSGWAIVISSRTDCSDEIGRFHQSTTVDSGVSAGAKSVRLEAVLPIDCPTLPASGGIKAYRDLSYWEGGGCRILTLANGGIPSFPNVGYPNGPRSLKFFGDHIDRAKVTLYTSENYTGTSCATYTQDMSDFLLCANKALSMKVEPYTAPTKASNIASLGTWDRTMTSALDNDAATWSPVPTGTNVGVVYSGNKLISGITIHDRPSTPDTNGIGTLYIGFGGGTSGGVFTNNLGLVSAGQRCVTYIPPTPINARWVNIKLIDSSGANGLSDVEIFESGGEIRPSINCPMINTSAPQVGETAPPANWVAPVSITLQTPNCDSKTLFLYKSDGSNFSDLCPSGGRVSGATSTNPCGSYTHFGGSNIVNLPDSSLLNRNAMETTMCVRMDNPHGHSMSLIRREMQNGGTADQFNLTAGEKITGGAYCASGHLGTTAVIPTGWHVLGIKFDSPNGAVALSIDGVVVESIPARSDSGTCPTWNSGYGPLVLGNNRANADYLIGDIAWVKIATP